jgi:two-component system, OmpR family, alkaline phosphatase synthesis response regulator PhoP
MKALPLILVVEDDPGIRRGVSSALTASGYRVLEAACGRTGLTAALENDVNLVLLDVVIPGMDGFAVLEQIRSALPTLPIIMLTARGAEDDRVRGLRGGADDYVVKPFGAMELLARVDAVLRRSPERPEPVRRLRCAGVSIDLQRMEVRTEGQDEARTLTEREGAILRYLAVTRGRVIERAEILRRVWGLDPRGIETRTVDMHVARLREKLGGDDEIVRTVRGRGYMLGDRVEVDL